MMNKHLILLSGLLALVLLVMSCSSDDLADLEIVPDYYRLQPGQSIELTVVGTNNLGSVISEFPEPTWTVEGTLGTISSMNGSNAIFTANQLGTETVVVTVGEISACAVLEILEEVPEPLVFHESFEDHTINLFPAGWTVKNIEFHLANQTGPRVTTDVPETIDGSKALKYTNLPRKDGVPLSEAYIPIPELKRGRIEFSVYQPDKESSNFGIKPYRDDQRLVNFWLSTGGDLRLPDKDGEKVGLGQWQTYAFEWDASTMKLKVFHLVGGKWQEKSPGLGYSINALPNRISIDGGTVEGRNAWGAIDNIKVYDLDLLW